MVAAIKSMQTSRDRYGEWNRPLVAAEADVIRSFFRPGGEALAKVEFEQFVTGLASHLHITLDALKRKAGLN